MTVRVVLVAIAVFSQVNAQLSLAPGDARRPFDQALYQDVLDPELCKQQVRTVTQNPMLLYRFLDSGIRIPRGILDSNLVDLGDYRQCLGIDQNVDDMRIEGKYCLIHVPTDQDLHWPRLIGNSQEFDPNTLRFDEETLQRLQQAKTVVSGARMAAGFEDTRSGIGNILSGLEFTLAVCVPKPCTTQDAISALLFNTSAVGFKYQEDFCRLPNDKPWVAVDYVAVVVFSFLGFLTLLSTCYDLNHTKILNKDPKTASKIGTSFSVYTNTKTLLTFKKSPSAIECLDGIRVLSMMWIIMAHSLNMYPYTHNMGAALSWLPTVEALWITPTAMTVDTFFMVGGVLLVYTAVGKMNGKQLLSHVHLFYLNRLLRMFPALAAIVLLDASVFHRIADGPIWGLVARNAQRCRSFWWSTLLHIQNWLNPMDMCIDHSWYIAIDVQLYFVSPLVLYWVMNGNKKHAWAALSIALLACITGSTIYNFIMELPGANVAFGRWSEFDEYLQYYYYNTLARGSPFFVGMLFGYLLNVCKGKKIKIPMSVFVVLWVLALGCLTSAVCTTYLIKQFTWDNQLVDNLVNSFQRPVWAAGVGWLIFACAHGYGGPINWFLSLSIWKLPSRLSYAMYLYHYSLQFIIADTQLAPNYFYLPTMVYDFVGQLALTLMISFAVGVLIEAPFNTLFKLMLDRGNIKPKKIQNGVAANKDVSA